MVQIGRFNRLRVIKKVIFGVYLEGDDSWSEILLPKQYVPNETEIGQYIDVFVYFDSNDKIIATTKHPYALMNEYAYLKVVGVHHVGVFLDWGLDKDLFVPYAEQYRPMKLGHSYIVYLTQDIKQRIIASTKIDYFLDKTLPDLKNGEQVDLLIAETTSLGTKAIINQRYWGLIHTTDMFSSLSYGQKTIGFVKKIRADHKIDISLRQQGYEHVIELTTHIILALEKNNGFLSLHDKSPAHEIMAYFQDSKKNYKNAIGRLYKQGKITIEEHGIRLR